MTYYTPRALSTNKLQQVITQTAHGFDVGHVLAFDGTDYILALADTEVDAQAVGIVSLVLSVDSFVITQEGFIVSMVIGAPFVAGSRYYLSETNPGELTLVKPTGVGEVVLALFDAITTDSGYFVVNPGTVITPQGHLPWSPVAINTSMAVNNGYFTNSGGTLLMALPATALLGDRLQLAAVTGAFQITQAANQFITLGANTTTVGVGGSVLSTTNGAGISLVCKVAGASTGWQADVGEQGIFTVT